MSDVQQKIITVVEVDHSVREKNGPFKVVGDDGNKYDVWDEGDAGWFGEQQGKRVAVIFEPVTKGEYTNYKVQGFDAVPDTEEMVETSKPEPKPEPKPKPEKKSYRGATGSADEKARSMALAYAKDLAVGTKASTDDIISNAKVFAQYILNGE